MDDTLKDFCRLVLDLRHKHISRHDLERTAVYLRDVAIPQLEAMEADGTRLEPANVAESRLMGRRKAVTA